MNPYEKSLFFIFFQRQNYKRVTRKNITASFPSPQNFLISLYSKLMRECNPRCIFFEVSKQKKKKKLVHLDFEIFLLYSNGFQQIPTTAGPPPLIYFNSGIDPSPPVSQCACHIYKTDLSLIFGYFRFCLPSFSSSRVLSET